MEDFAEYLVSQTKTGSAALHEFLLRFKDHEDAVHLFFEGEEDPAFYMPVIRSQLTKVDKWKYVCGGKPALRGVRDYLVTQEYPLDSVMFFVDRDFDDLFDCQISPSPKTFITEYYSVENYLVGRGQAETVLVDLAGLSQSDKDCAQFLTNIEELSGNWADLMLPFIAYTLAAREMGMSPNLSNINLAKVCSVSVDLGGLRKKKDAFQSYKVAVLPREATVSFPNVLRWGRRLRSTPIKLWLRGKYELWFFEKSLLMFLEQIAAKRRASKQRIPRIPSSLRDGRLFEALGGRLEPIAQLDDFIRDAVPAKFLAQSPRRAEPA